MIKYQKTYLTPEALALLKKLPFPILSILVDLENKFISLIKITYDDKTYGLMVTRGEYNRAGELVLVVLHLIAVDGLEDHLSSIISESIDEWLISKNFKRVRVETDNSGLYRIAKKFMGDPVCFVFERLLNADKSKFPLHESRQRV